MAILLLPVGPPGSGKTFLGKYLQHKLKDRFKYLSRDEIFKTIREKNSIRNSKHLTHQYIKTQLESYNNHNYIVYIDTTNSNQGIRDLYKSYLKPNRVIYICFRENNIDKLLERVTNRDHPTFPNNQVDQIKTINKIINTISYPTDNCIDIFSNEDIENVINFLQ